MSNSRDKSEPLDEPMYALEEIAKSKRLHPATIRKLFVAELGVIRLGHAATARRGQCYRLRIPANVADCVFGRMTEAKEVVRAKWPGYDQHREPDRQARRTANTPTYQRRHDTGLPRRFTAVILAGGRSLRFPRPAASRSKTRIASASWSRSTRRSMSILWMSILGDNRSGSDWLS